MATIMYHTVEGDRGAGARENRGREHERTGGVRGREAGEQGAGSGSRNKEGDSCDRTSTNA